MQTWSTEQAPELRRDAEYIHVRGQLIDRFLFNRPFRGYNGCDTVIDVGLACLLGLDMDGCTGVEGQ